MAGLYFTNINGGKGAPLLDLTFQPYPIDRDGGISGSAFDPSCVHIIKRDPKPNRPRYNENLWTDMWPHCVHITYMDSKQNRYIENEY